MFDLVPDQLRLAIGEANDWLEQQINLGVYRAGFAQSQADYEQACRSVFGAFDQLEST